jgi:hypothetical protein
LFDSDPAGRVALPPSPRFPIPLGEHIAAARLRSRYLGTLSCDAPLLFWPLAGTTRNNANAHSEQRPAIRPGIFMMMAAIASPFWVLRSQSYFIEKATNKLVLMTLLSYDSSRTDGKTGWAIVCSSCEKSTSVFTRCKTCPSERRSDRQDRLRDNAAIGVFSAGLRVMSFGTGGMPLGGTLAGRMVGPR